MILKQLALAMVTMAILAAPASAQYYGGGYYPHHHHHHLWWSGYRPYYQPYYQPSYQAYYAPLPDGPIRGQAYQIPAGFSGVPDGTGINYGGYNYVTSGGLMYLQQ